MDHEKIILGIDPGTTIMGFGVIKVVNKKMQFLQLNELILSKYDDHYTKLKVIFERTIELIETFGFFRSAWTENAASTAFIKY